MKTLTFPTLLGAFALILASCDKPKVAAPTPPPPGSNGQFANGGATGLVARIRALSTAVKDAQKAEDTTKNEQFLAQAMTLLTEARSYSASVSRAEMPQFAAQLTDYLKPLSDLAATAAPELAARFARELNNTNQIIATVAIDYGALSSTHLDSLAPAPESSRIPHPTSYAGAPKGSAGYDSSARAANPYGTGSPEGKGGAQGSSPLKISPVPTPKSPAPPEAPPVPGTK